MDLSGARGVDAPGVTGKRVGEYTGSDTRPLLTAQASAPVDKCNWAAMFSATGPFITCQPER
jgi:hypothetical protein